MYFLVRVQVFMFLTVNLESCIFTAILVQDVLPRNRLLPRRQLNLPCSELLISLIACRPQVHCFVSLLFSFLGLTRIKISLLKDTARLFIRVAADIDFHHCMIFSNSQIFKLACFFRISKLNDMEHIYIKEC